MKKIDQIFNNPKKAYIIAEIGSNFNQSLETGFKLIDVAKNSGADAVKFQMFKADTLYPKDKKMNSIFKSIELQKNMAMKFFNYSFKKKIDFFGSSFDEESFLFLEKIGSVAHKVASSETTNLSLLKEFSKSKKPIIISTGMCDIADIYEAVEVCKINNQKIVLLHTSSLYPTNHKDVNISAISTLEKIFNLPVGFSDHTLDDLSAVMSISYGAKVIEKHITLDKNSKGPDHFYASDPDEFSKYVKSIRLAEKIIGNSEIKMHKDLYEFARRDSIHIKKNVKKNEMITLDKIEIKRPATGILSRYLNAVLGKTFNSDIKKGNSLKWHQIK